MPCRTRSCLLPVVGGAGADHILTSFIAATPQMRARCLGHSSPQRCVRSLFLTVTVLSTCKSYESRKLSNMFRIISLCFLATLVRGSRLFQSEIFRDHGVQQALLPLPAPVSHDNPRYSNSSFPGDQTGASPFFYCPESDPETDIFAIDTVVLNPNPPHM